MYKSLHNQAPQYLISYIPTLKSRALRSTDSALCMFPGTSQNRGDKAFFSVVGPKLWNSLPIHIRIASTLSIFKSTLKTDFFSLAFNVFLTCCAMILYITSSILHCVFHSLHFVYKLVDFFCFANSVQHLVDFGVFKCLLINKHFILLY